MLRGKIVASELKQRIVGICVLVFLALIIVPWLFSTHPAYDLDNQKTHPLQQMSSTTNFDDPITAVPAEAAQVAHITPVPTHQKPNNSKRNPSNDTDQHQPKSSLAPNEEKIHENDTALPHEESAAIAKEAQPVTNQNALLKASTSLEKTTKENPAAKIHAVKPATLSKIESNLISRSKTRPLAKKVDLRKASKEIELYQPNFEKIKIAAKTAHSKTSTKHEKNITLQLGTFSNQTNAGKLVKQLKSKGYQAYSKVSTTDANKVIRVFVDTTDLKAANTALKKIERTFKLHGAIVKANV